MNRFSQRTIVSPTILALLPKFSRRRRNEIRGALNHVQENGLSEGTVETLRNNNSQHDMTLSAMILEGPAGLKRRVSHGLKQDDLWKTYGGPTKTLELETAYACGFLNCWKNDVLKAIGTIQMLARISDFDFDDACTAIEESAKEWGASRYLCYKIAFLKNQNSRSEIGTTALANADKILGHDESPYLQHSAVENTISSISIFSVARRHTNTLKSKVGHSFRRRHNLGNLVATPISDEDAAEFIRRAVATSLLDTVHSMWVLLNLADQFRDFEETLPNSLDGEILKAFSSTISLAASYTVPKLFDGTVASANEEEDLSLFMYRQSAIFLEHPKICRFRNDIDRVVGLRLIAQFLPEQIEWPCRLENEIDFLRKPNAVFDLEKHRKIDIQIDVFYRTYLFLRFIQDPINLSYLSEDDIKFIFNNTTHLDSLLLQTELQTMHLNASETTRPLVSVLALALFRDRSSDPDVDYDYRQKLEEYIIENCGGDIPKFINSLTVETPQVASYLATSLDESTLQKMYRLVTSSKQASMIRRDILNLLGNALGRIEYIIEAEAIDTRSKVGKLKQYFDTSRMFVDSVVMRDWLQANPSAYTQQYKELLPKLVARLAAYANITDEATGETKQIPIVEIASTADQLISQIGKEAFREFCLNNHFGIESYLGRRIRHNTLHGVMINPIDYVLNKPMYRPVIVGTEFGSDLRSWEIYFRNFIERMRSEFLQFRSNSKPQSLFSSELDFSDSATRRGLTQLSNTIRLSGADMMPDLIISFCWQQIGPQLEYASRQIKVQMASEVTQRLHSMLGQYQGLEERKILAELSEGVETVFSKVASWFRLPETGFIPASVKDLCKIIDIEIGREEQLTRVSGNALDTEYYGISVHRMYDCLAVLIQNAVKHGELFSEIWVVCNTVGIPHTNLHNVTIAVCSEISPDEATDKIQQIKAALVSTESGKDMVTEGFSGLKKLKYITKLNEGAHTVTLSHSENHVEVSFSLKVEITTGGEQVEADPAG